MVCRAARFLIDGLRFLLDGVPVSNRRASVSNRRSIHRPALEFIAREQRNVRLSALSGPYGLGPITAPRLHVVPALPFRLLETELSRFTVGHRQNGTFLPGFLGKMIFWKIIGLDQVAKIECEHLERPGAPAPFIDSLE
jgi:hypothetical protein